MSVLQRQHCIASVCVQCANNIVCLCSLSEWSGSLSLSGTFSPRAVFAQNENGSLHFFFFVRVLPACASSQFTVAWLVFSTYQLIENYIKLKTWNATSTFWFYLSSRTRTSISVQQRTKNQRERKKSGFRLLHRDSIDFYREQLHFSTFRTFHIRTAKKHIQTHLTSRNRISKLNLIENFTVALNTSFNHFFVSQWRFRALISNDFIPCGHIPFN